MLTLDPASLQRLRAALLVRGRPSLPLTSGAVVPAHPLTEEQQAHVERVAPVCELLFLMMAADGTQETQERELLRGAVRALTDGKLRSAHIDAMLDGFEQQLLHAGIDARLASVTARLQTDRAEAEAAYALTAAMALVDSDVTGGERDLLAELGDLLGLSEKRRVELTKVQPP